MNKSYQSIKQIKDRLSQSKMSQRSNLSRSSSRSSLKSSNSARGKPFPKNKRPPQPMKVRAMDINKVDRREIDKFKGLFLKGNTNSKQTIEN